MSPFVMSPSGHHTLSAFFTSASARLGVTLAPAAFARVLVLAEPQERGLAQLPIAGPLLERDLCDELRPRPRRIAHARRRIERRPFGAERRQRAPELGERLRREAGADLAGVAEPVVVVEPDEERAEVRAGALRRREAADDELGFLAHLDLEPLSRADARLVRGADVLGDDALPPLGLRRRVRVRAASGKAPAQEERRVPPREQRLQRGAATAQGLGEELAPVVLEEIEDGVAQAYARFTTPLEELEP